MCDNKKSNTLSVYLEKIRLAIKVSFKNGFLNLFHSEVLPKNTYKPDNRIEFSLFNVSKIQRKLNLNNTFGL